MPKIAKPVSVKICEYVREFYDDLEDRNGQLFCTWCNTLINCSRRSQVTQHLKTSNHIKNKGFSSSRFRNSINERRQELGDELVTALVSADIQMDSMGDIKKELREEIVTALVSADIPMDPLDERDKEFREDLVIALISADIPMNKICNRKFREFLEKWTNIDIPNETSLRRQLRIKHCEVIKSIREKVGNNFIWISIDETVDATERSVISLVIGTLNKYDPGESYLLHTDFLDKVDHRSIAQVINDGLMILWPDGIKYNKVLLMVTDGASYMIKAGQGLSILYPKLIHLTCFSHSINRISEAIRGNDIGYTSEEIQSLIYAPFTPCDIQKTCAKYKPVLSEQRHCLTNSELEMYMVICCYPCKE